MTEQLHYCYILYNNIDMKTYVGYTTNPLRRLRQHNGLLVGGARFTKRNNNGNWMFLAVITSPSFTNNLALSFEWHLKHGHRKTKSVKHRPLNRIASLINNIKTNCKFKGLEYHIYVSHFCQDILQNANNTTLTDILELDNVCFYDVLGDII